MVNIKVGYEHYNQATTKHEYVRALTSTGEKHTLLCCVSLLDGRWCWTLE